MLSISSAPITKNTRVFVAADLEVDFEGDHILDTYRLDCMLPTLKYILEKGGFPILGGHIGRPDGKVVPELSTQRLVPYFDAKLGAGNYELLENVRFDPREEANDDQLTRELSATADMYVNEVFSTSHRDEVFITGIPKYLPAFAGFRLEEEIKNLSMLTSNAARPFVTVIGGAKLADKKSVVIKFSELADHVLLGGKVGLQWTTPSAKVVTPTDYARDQMDIGPVTIATFSKLICEAKTILWAGPMGRYEDPEFMTGSLSIAQAIAKATKDGAHSVAGGGDTAAILTNAGLRDEISFVSTGGGAMLEFLIHGTLPGIQALG